MEQFDKRSFFNGLVAGSTKGFHEVPAVLCDNFDFMLTAIKCNPYSLKYASERLKENRQIVFTAVSHGAGAIEYASESLKKDKEILLVALFVSVQDRWRRAYDFYNDTIEDGDIFNHFGDCYKETILVYADKSLKNDKDFILTAMKINPRAYFFASEQLRKDESFEKAKKQIMGEIKKYFLGLKTIMDTIGKLQKKADEEVDEKIGTLNTLVNNLKNNNFSCYSNDLKKR